MDFLNADGGFPLGSDDQAVDQKVRGMLHLVMSLPNYQLA
jgi:hypothetical protein